ncbi:MAG TPA: transcription termination/antitermination factor NusG [Acholeplasmataceae bacterium]|nr:transcription termination/antitermination factor NusG [Acholeplasmataceae bacterium]
MTERAWYILQTYSGCESAAKKNIEAIVESQEMEDIIFNVIVPEEVHMEKTKKGELKEVFVKPFPGYVFIDMIVTDDSWFTIRNTPMVTGFLGSSGGGTKPVPVLPDEMESILKIAGLAKKSSFAGKIGDKVKIIAGNFSGQYGTIDFIDEQKRVVKVLIDFFGRQTPAELSFDEIVL